MNEVPINSSPPWGSTTKLLVGLVMIGIFAFLLVRFQNLISPLLMIFIISYLFHPLAALIANSLNISWKAAVNILYLSILISVVGLLTVGGIGLVQQVQNLINQVQSIIASLPGMIEQISGQVYQIGPFTLDMPALTKSTLIQDILSFVQPLLGRTGNLVGAVASRAVQIIGWMFFILIVSYFIVSESNGLASNVIRIDLPGHSEDLRKLGSKLGRIWNAFLRGQIIIFFMAFAIYTVLLNVLGVKYALGLALMAGLARFLPYIGPAITWITMGLVTFFQTSKPFNLEAHPLVYVAIVVVSSLIIDQIMDNYVSPRIMAQTLRVHPAAVLVAALIMANLLGILGVVIAAPLLASLTLLGRYTMRKMFDLDPFPPSEATPRPPGSRDLTARFRLLRRIFHENMNKNTISDKEKPDEQQ
jgi:predicted PurR-regulated permease PerM